MSRRTGQTGKHSPKRTVAPEEVQATLLQLLSEIAPDADFTELRPTDSLPERLEIDSIDLEHFLLALEQRMQSRFHGPTTAGSRPWQAAFSI